MQMRDKKRFLTHKLDAQVICRFQAVGSQMGGGGGMKREGERGRENKVIVKNSARKHCVTAYSQITVDLFS